MATSIEFGGGPSTEVRSESTQPKYGTHLVGYTGYIPGMKYHCGKNFPALSHYLAQCIHNHKHPAAGYSDRYFCDRFSQEQLRRLDVDLSKHCTERRFFVDLPPGYTGSIPRFMYESIGLRFGKGNIKSLQEYVCMRQEIDANLADLICRQECKKCLEPQICEDKISEMLKNSGDKRYPCGYPSRRQPMEPPMFGYMGHIPRTKVMLETSGMNHQKEACFGIVTFDCLKKYNDRKLKNPCVDPTSEILPNVCLDPPTIYRIYMQDGMIPRYTGVVPENLFVFGKTYGDSTRSVQSCYHGEPNYGIYQKKKFEAQPVETTQIIT